MRAFDAATSPASPNAANARAEKEQKLKIFEQSAARATTLNCETQMTAVKAASTALQTAANAKEQAAKQFAGVGSRIDTFEAVEYLEMSDGAADARSAFRKTLFDAQEAVKLQREAEGTPEGDAKAARANFVLAGYQRAAAEMELNDVMHDPAYKAQRIADAQRDLDVAVMQYRDAASEASTVSQAWADNVKQHGSREDIVKSGAWVKEANDNLKKLPQHLGA